MARIQAAGISDEDVRRRLRELGYSEELLDRYLGGAESTLGNWLLSRREDELLISITPQRLFSWDYRQRMDGAG